MSMSYKILKDLNRVILDLERVGNREASRLHDVFVKIADVDLFCTKCGKEMGKYSSMCGACGNFGAGKPFDYSVGEEQKDPNSEEAFSWRPGTKDEKKEYLEFDRGQLFCDNCGNKTSPYSSMCTKCGKKK